MITLALVAGEDVAETMWPFFQDLEVEPYEVVLRPDEIRDMSHHYGIAPDNLDALAAKMENWSGNKGIVKDGRLVGISTHNPKAKFDSYRVCDRTEDMLLLQQPRKVRRFFGLLPPRVEARVPSARKGEIDEKELLDHPPPILVRNGEWLEDTMWETAAAKEKWRRDFAERFEEIPDEMLLTLIEVHI